MQVVSAKCSSGLTVNRWLNRVAKHIIELYSTLLLRVAAELAAAMPNRITVLAKGGRVGNGQ